MQARVMAALGAAVVVCAGAAGPAGAATRTVTMGPPSSTSEQLRELGGSDANAFFPSRTTIRTGDKVRFVPLGFHNVDLPATGGGPAPLFKPTGAKAQGEQATDAAGAPFWFGGLDVLGLNPDLAPAFGRTVSFDGEDPVNSGLPLGDDLEPLVVRFRRTGRFTYFCDVHPGMKGSVRVKKRKAKIPSERRHRRAVSRQAAKALETAEQVVRATPPASTILLGSAGRGGVESLAFYPASATVPVGTTLRFRMSPGSYETHTATVGPGDPGNPQDTGYLRKLAASFESPAGIDPRASYPSERPGSPPADLTPSLHGNGFWNSGALDAVDETPQLPSETSVRLAQAGTYTFYCLIHPFMKGTVTAQ